MLGGRDGKGPAPCAVDIQEDQADHDSNSHDEDRGRLRAYCIGIGGTCHQRVFRLASADGETHSFRNIASRRTGMSAYGASEEKTSEDALKRVA